MKPHIVTEDMRLRARDGQELEGKLYLPWDGVVSRLVVQVNGSGPQTCNTFRDRGDGTTYSFCGFFGEELAGRGTGFLLLQHPAGAPMGIGVHSTAEWTGQSTALHPSDLCGRPGGLDRLLQAHPRCAGAELLLLGWSEGTMIARLWLQGERYPWPDCCWRATPTGPWRRP